MPSILQNYDLVKEAVESSNSTREVLHKLGLRSAGGNYAALKKACLQHNLPQPIGTGAFQTQKANKLNTIPLEEILIENSSYTNRSHLKKKLYREGLLKEQCYECGQKPIWNNKPLTLQLEHLNGIWNDHRIENLQILCPNCHTQTHSYAGKSSKIN